MTAARSSFISMGSDFDAVVPIIYAFPFVNSGKVIYD